MARRLSLVLALLLSLPAVVAAPADAQTAEPTIRVVIVGGALGNASTAEVEVVVTSSRALSGRVEVVSRWPDGGDVTYVVPVDVAAGATAPTAAR